MGIKVKHDPAAGLVALGGYIGGYGEYGRWATQEATKRRGQSLAFEATKKSLESAERRAAAGLDASAERQRVSEGGAFDRMKAGQAFTTGRDKSLAELARVKADEDADRRNKADKQARRNALDAYEEKDLADYERTVAEIEKGVASGDYSEENGKRLILEARQRYARVADLKGIKKQSEASTDPAGWVKKHQITDENGIIYDIDPATEKPEVSRSNQIINDRNKIESGEKVAIEKARTARDDKERKVQEKAVQAQNDEATKRALEKRAERVESGEESDNTLEDDIFDSLEDVIDEQKALAMARARFDTGGDEPSTEAAKPNLDEAYDRLSPEMQNVAKAMILELGQLKGIDTSGAVKRRTQIAKELRALGLEV